MATLDPSIAPLADAGLDPLVGMWTGAPASQAVTVVDHAAPALSLSEKFATAHLPACNCAACSGATHPVSSELSSSPSPDGTALTALDAQYLYNTPQPATNAVLSQQAAYQWHGAAAGQALVINYTFATQFPYGYDSTFSSSTWSVFSASEQAAVRQILGLYSQVANITFNEVSYNHVDPAAMMFGGNVNMPGAAAVTYLYGSTHLYYADVFVDDNYNHPAAGNYDYLALIHEIGHALGLKHPGNYNAGGGGADGPYLSSYGLADTRQYTVMSYNGHASYGSVEPLTPQLLDVAAVQYLYGANTGFHSGNDTYTFSTSPQIMTIWDGGGIDTFDASNETSNSRIDLNPGAFSSIGAGFGQNNIAIAYGASIENAIGGSGNDSILGNSLANSLAGGGGNDSLAGIGGDDELYGGAGADSLDGGDGNDYLEGGVGADALIGGGGYDTAAYRTSAAGVNVNLSTGAGSGGDAAGDTYSGIEYLRGSDFADTLAGDANNNWMAGYDGNDSLAGNGGDDWLLGGAGNDTIEGGDGSDGVFGDAGNDELYGGAGNDQLYGGDGNDTLYGGSGADTLVGGAGTDTAVFAGSEAAYAIAFSNGSFSLTEAGTLVILRDIEFARFTDGTLDLTGFA